MWVHQIIDHSRDTAACSHSTEGRVEDIEVRHGRKQLRFPVGTAVLETHLASEYLLPDPDRAVSRTRSPSPLPAQIRHVYLVRL